MTTKKSQPKHKKRAKTVRLSEDIFDLIPLLKTNVGVTEAAIWEMALREFAKLRGVKLPIKARKA